MVNPKLLLVLDDDPAVARTIGFVAESQGLAVQCHTEACAFLAAVAENEPGYVALDLIMPGMDGVEVLRRLAGTRCASGIILTSGMGERVLESARQTARERGLDILGVLPKPFKPQLLRELLGRVPRGQGAPPPPAGTEAALCAAELGEALDAGQISIVAQPKLDLATRAVVGAEALARWKHPTRGFVRPDHFVALAEATGQMDRLTEVVLDQALAWFSRSPLRQRGSLAVNLSTSCLADVGLADRVQSACRDYAVPAERLVLEITESSAMDRTADTFDTLTRLRLKGFHLSVDDFGTGYSSLAQLARLPLSEIKIDKSFVIALPTSRDARKIVDAILHLAQGMGLACVAEGVEDGDVLETLAGLGCQQAQGYFISRPMPGAEFDAWLAGRPEAGT